MEPVRVLVLTPITAPYRVPVFNQLHASVDLDVRVVYLAERDPTRRWPAHYERMQYSYRVLNERKTLRWGPAYLHLSTGLASELWWARRGVVVIGGWDQPLHHVARWLRRALGYRTVAWVESTARDARRGSRVLERVKRSFLTGCAAVVVPGRASEAYVASLGVESEEVFIAPNAVDVERFSRGAVDRSARSGAPTVLFVGRLEREKGLDLLLEAWRLMSDADAHLAVAGEGSLADKVLAADNVTWLREVDPDDLVGVYANADVFVLPSRTDPWGLVLNEAMAAALPVVTTRSPGAVDDLVHDGDNGFVVASNADSLRHALERLIADRQLRLSMGRRSAEIVSCFTPAACAAGLARAVRHASRIR